MGAEDCDAELPIVSVGIQESSSTKSLSNVKTDDVVTIQQFGSDREESASTATHPPLLPPGPLGKELIPLPLYLRGRPSPESKQA